MIETFKDTYKTLFSKLTLSIWAVTSLLAVLPGPFGTFEAMSWTQLAIYWTSITTSSILLGYFAFALTRCVLGYEETTVSRMLTGVLGTLFISTDVYALSHWVYGFSNEGPSYFSLLGLVGFVFFSVILGRFMFTQAVVKTADENRPLPIQIVVPAPAEKPCEPRLFKRLPFGGHEQVYRLSANDHFVHVSTKTGVHEIRMRLRDAIQEMDHVDGMLVHRSHWVARDAMRSLIRAQGKVSVILTNGEHVPVSRKYRDDVEALNLPKGVNDGTCAAKAQSEASAL